MMINLIKRDVQEAMKYMRGFELIMITEGSPEETLNCGKRARAEYSWQREQQAREKGKDQSKQAKKTQI